MDKTQIEEKKRAEREVVHLFNRQNQTNAEKKDLEVGQSTKHEFDLYEPNKVIGGITTSPWKNSTGSYNTGGQDRASTELLWLSLWQGRERRVMILTDTEMADRLFKRWQGCKFPRQIEILHCDLGARKFRQAGVLGERSI